MPLLISNSVQYELRLGDNVLGGRGADAVPHPMLGDLPAAAAIAIHTDGHPEIRRLDPGIVVRVNGRYVGIGGSRLHHGARIDVGPCRLVYVDTAAAATTADPARRGRAAPPMTELAPVVPSERVTARLVAVRSGLVVTVPMRGLVIGRSRSSGLVLDGDGVSRRHAVIAPSREGYSVRDQSANGTWLNGARVQGTAPLSNGDVLRIGEEELRFETDGASPVITSEDAVATRLAPSPLPAAAPVSAPEAAPSPGAPAGPALATLVVESGSQKGTTFRVARAVCSIGRSSGSDVVIADESVSASHATLLLKAGTWFVVDLRSANGTFVDGYRVAGERELPAGAMLRIGGVKLRFRPGVGAPATPGGTQKLSGMLDRFARER